MNRNAGLDFLRSTYCWDVTLPYSSLIAWSWVKLKGLQNHSSHKVPPVGTSTLVTSVKTFLYNDIRRIIPPIHWLRRTFVNGFEYSDAQRVVDYDNLHFNYCPCLNTASLVLVVTCSRITVDFVNEWASLETVDDQCTRRVGMGVHCVQSLVSTEGF